MLEAEDDAATANWGSDWRMPTQEEIDQLRKYCTWTWTTLNGVNGYSVVGPNGNSIFLPAAGTHLDAVVETDEWGYYWSSSLLSSTSSLASCLYFYSTKYSADNFDRASGRTIRPVRAEVKQEKHEYIDLGLPSGTLWANMNVGAAAPADFGDYFSWGETAPKDSYDWGDYKHSFSNSKIYKYNTSSTYGEVDSLTVLEAIDDAATANWGSEWRTPTLEEMEELIQYCTWTWTTLRGVNGQLAVGPNGNSIFLPAAGSRSRDYISYADSSGWYWTSSLHSTNIRANYVSFGSGTPDVGYTLRCSGHSVRPVQSPIRN